MVKLLGALALMVAFTGSAWADCSAGHTAMSTPTVTAQGSSSTPATPAPQTPGSGG